jgi:hypothetical protein
VIRSSSFAFGKANLFFVCRREIDKISPFEKEKRCPFFFAKKKKGRKKKLATLQVDRLSTLCFEAMKTLRKSLRLGAERFACRILRRDSDVFLFFVRLGRTWELGERRQGFGDSHLLI